MCATKWESKSLSEVLTTPTSTDVSQFQRPLLQAKAFFKQAIWKSTLMMMMISMMAVMMMI